MFEECVYIERHESALQNGSDVYNECGVTTIPLQDDIH